jgi:tetratricopeptide (TPR) repeat protein
MFFPRLRRRAKWVFLLLAVVFAGGFLVFGVGTGVQGTSIGDIVQDIFNSGGPDQPSVDDARKKLEQNPDDADAQLELANALEAAGQNDEAAAALVRYTELRPKDVDGLLQLAAVYDRQANEARDQAAIAQSEAFAKTPGQLFAPPADTPLGQALTQNPIDQALTATASVPINAAFEEVGAAYGRSQGVFEKLTQLDPNEPQYFVRLGQASEGAGDTASAIAAYQRFLELSPDDSVAPLVKRQLDTLTGATEPEPASTSASG